MRVIRTVDGEEVRLDPMPTPVIQNDSLRASIDGERYSIATENIVDYKVEPADVRRSIGLALLPLVIAGLVYMIKVVKPSAIGIGGTDRAESGDYPRASSVNHSQETSGTRRARFARIKGGVASMRRSPHLGFSQNIGASLSALDAETLHSVGARTLLSIAWTNTTPEQCRAKPGSRGSAVGGAERPFSFAEKMETSGRLGRRKAAAKTRPSKSLHNSL